MPAVEWPQLLEDMTDALRIAAEESGLSEGQAEKFSLTACKRLIELVFYDGAVQLYMPSKNTVARRERDREIREKAKRMTIKQLCEAYPELSEPRIRHILKPPPKRKRRGKKRNARYQQGRRECMKRQGSLF